MSLTEKQKMFADEYLIDLNATRAYKAVYKSIKKDNVAAQAGSRLLRNVKVKKYIDERMAQIHNEKTADAQEVIEYLTSVMRGQSESEVIVVEDKGKGISSARRINKLPDEKEKLKAAELIGKRYGMFKESVDISASLPVVISGDDKLED